MSAPQFGASEAARSYKDRPAAFGILLRDARIAAVRVQKPGHAPWLDLPGGALDPGEDEAKAVVREFGEETGLKVTAGELFARADQRFINTDGQAFNNRAAFLVLSEVGEDAGLKIEDDHTLIWLEPDEAIATLRHEAHAWSVAAWLRWKRR